MKSPPAHVLEAVEAERARGGDWLYHETLREHLPSIRAEGLRPTSYGQSFVRDDGSVASPEEALDEIRSDLDEEAMLEDEEVTDEELEERARERLRDEHPPEDFRRRTYVLLSEPARLSYAEVLLRFPRSAARPTMRGDVDWHVFETVPHTLIEVRGDDGRWRRLA